MPPRLSRGMPWSLYTYRILYWRQKGVMGPHIQLWGRSGLVHPDAPDIVQRGGLRQRVVARLEQNGLRSRSSEWVLNGYSPQPPCVFGQV